MTVTKFFHHSTLGLTSELTRDIHRPGSPGITVLSADHILHLGDITRHHDSTGAGAGAGSGPNRTTSNQGGTH